MFSGIGIWEVLLIIVVILVVLGPQRVPEIARKLGQIVRTIRRAGTDFSTAVTRELDVTRENPSPPTDKTKSPDTSSKPDKHAVTKRVEKPAVPEEQRPTDE
jgi:sec-independent protein translocase protein TatA